MAAGREPRPAAALMDSQCWRSEVPPVVTPKKKGCHVADGSPEHLAKIVTGSLGDRGPVSQGHLFNFLGATRVPGSCCVFDEPN